jgi:restriction endonuclease S subunit
MSFYDGNIPWVITSELRENIISDTLKKITDRALEEHSALILYPSGTLLIAMYGATIGRLGILGISACTNQACCAFADPMALDIKFAFYWLWMRRQEIIILSSGGGQPNINQEKLKDIRIPAPLLPEQRSIAAFLDRKTAHIDIIISKKERLITLLQEKRAALISHTVTKGLDPDVPMKDSGVEWLGEIPVHWNVKKLGYQSQMIVPMRDKPPIFNGKTPWIRIEDFNGKYISDSKSNQRVNDEIISKMNLKVYPVGTVLCSCSCNMGATAIVKKPLISNQTFIGILPQEHINSEFLFYLMNTNSDRLQYLSSGAIQQYLSKEDFQSLKLAFPPLSEQHAISSFLDRETVNLNTLIAKIQEAIEKLQEYRIALISAAVTGKIDVRNENRN